MAERYIARDGPFRPEAVWSLDGEDLVRTLPTGETRWPLAGLSRMALQRQINRYGTDLRFAELRFGRKTVSFASRTWRGVGRPHDQTSDFAAFVRAVASRAAAASPAARFEVRGVQPWAMGLWSIAALLAGAVLAMLAVALSAGLLNMGLDLASRLLFVLLLLLAVAPWLPARGGRSFDPQAVPDDLAPRP